MRNNLLSSNIIPLSVRKKIRSWLDALRRELKAPKMIVGYVDSTGAWRANTRISDTVFFDHPERIEIHDNVFVWHYSILDGTGGVIIEEGCQIGAWVGIFTHSSHIAIRLYGAHYHESEGEQKRAYPIAPVRIGKYTFVGAGAKILPGVTIGKGSIIAAGSIVSKNVGDFQIVSGNPAEVIGDTRRLDKRYLKDSALRRWYEEWQRV
jgi:acetyltransferase-like isoleucine patch superfamily enzyme